MWRAAVIAGALVGQVEAHANMQWPPTWFDANGSVGLTPGGQCAEMPSDTAFCMWFTNNTRIPGPTTLPLSMRTYFTTVPYMFSNTNVPPPEPPPANNTPWLAPGTAPIDSPCGVSGGNLRGCPIGKPAPPDGQCPGGGTPYGSVAENVTFVDVVTTEWTAGGTAEVGFGIAANHGGGYSYRLCPKPPTGKVVTEECFQAHPLDFDGDMQWVQYGPNGTRTHFLANRTREGTFPAGSQWTKNPIPACAAVDGGYYTHLSGIGCGKLGVQFPPPAEGLLGFGAGQGEPGHWRFLFSVMDRVRVPKLAVGEYVLSWRWDCEQTTQVWNTCSNIRIV